MRFPVSPEAAEKSIFSGLIAAGTHLMSIAVLLLVKQQPSVAVLAGLGWDAVRFLAPARPGDTLVTSRDPMWRARFTPRSSGQIASAFSVVY